MARVENATEALGRSARCSPGFVGIRRRLERSRARAEFVRADHGSCGRSLLHRASALVVLDGSDNQPHHDDRATGMNTRPPSERRALRSGARMFPSTNGA